MRVLCVKSHSGIGIYEDTGRMVIPEDDAQIAVGETYTVYQEIGNPATHYRLSEKNKSYCYAVKFFAPLSSVDELQLTESSTNTP